jgi:hypothetical protein
MLQVVDLIITLEQGIFQSLFPHTTGISSPLPPKKSKTDCKGVLCPNNDIADFNFIFDIDRMCIFFVDFKLFRF